MFWITGLSLLLFTMAILTYVLGNKSLLSVSLVSNGVFFIFCFLYVLFKEFTVNDISTTMFLCIFGYNAAVLIGELVGKHICIFKNNIRSVEERDIFLISNGGIEVSKKKTILVSLLLFLAGSYRFCSVLRYARKVGVAAGFLSTIGNVRNYGNYINDTGPFVSVFIYIGNFLAIIYIFIFVYNYVRFKKLNALLLFPVFSAIFAQLPNGDRESVIPYVAAFIIAYLYNIDVERKIDKIMFNPLKIVVFFVVFLFVFFVYGAATRKTGLSSVTEIKRMIIGYSCSTIWNLNYYIDNIAFFNSHSYGKDFFKYIYSFFHTNEAYSYYNYFAFGRGTHYPSNIYTGLRAIIHDFGYFGLLPCGFLISYIGTRLTIFIKRSKFNSYKFYIFYYFYALWMYSVAMMPISCQFIKLFIAPAYLIRVIVGIVVSYFFFLDIRLTGRFRKKTYKLRRGIKLS